MTTQATSDFGRELLAQRDWLLRLAHSLVADPTLAEDLVQETWLSALRTRPASEGGLRGWLATVLRNRARTRLRDDARRAWRERLASREEATASTGDVVERAGVQQEVVAAVMALDEPFRETLLLRYFDELPPRTIAERMHVPLSTVKSRLQRGMDKLRERLDASYGGDRRAWMAGVFALVEVEEGSWLGKAVAAAAGLLLVGGGATWVALEKWPSSELVREVGLPLADDAVAELSQRSEIGSASGLAADRAGGQVEQAPRGGASRDHARPKELGYAVAPPRQRPKLASLSPPGLIPVEGGTTWIGSDLDELEELVTQHPQAPDMVPLFLAEIPRHEVEVESFHLMATEVTNQQYLAYVRSTGAVPPQTWVGEPVLRSGDEPEESIPWSSVGDSPELEERTWSRWLWEWQDGDKELPKEWLLLPVVGLRPHEAVAYARWAGLRLPTEIEFERAARGRKGTRFPWGERWHASCAATLESSKGPELSEVGRHKKGATREGIHDLCGNAAELTASTFEPYPGWEVASRLPSDLPWSVELGSLPAWSGGTSLVVRGGSHLSPWPLVRVSAREALPTSRDERGSALGFRCAASADPRRDSVALALAQVSSGRGRRSSPLMPSSVSRDREPRTPPSLDRVVGLWRWLTTKRRPRAKVKHYAVIEGHQFALFVPGTPDELGLTLPRSTRLRRADHYVGVFSSNLELVSASGEPDVYLVAFWPAQTQSPWSRNPPPGCDASRDQLLLVDMQGQAVACYPAAPLEPGTGQDLRIYEDRIEFPLALRQGRGQGRVATLRLSLPPTDLEGDWRR